MLAKSAIFVSFWQVHVLSETDPDISDFRAAQVNIGLFGVVTEVTVRVTNKFKLEENRIHTSLDECLANMDELVHKSGYEYFKIWVEFYHDFCIQYHTTKTDKPIKEPYFLSLLSFLTVSLLQCILYIYSHPNLLTE